VRSPENQARRVRPQQGLAGWLVIESSLSRFPI
jgi:hypothetical protein